MARRVLITGATGFTGSFLAELYLTEGWEVDGTYLEHPGSAQADVRLHQVDLRDGDAVVRLLRTCKPDLVQHLAAQSSVRISWDQPSDTVVGNVQAQILVLEAARRYCPAARVVVTGSADEYGRVAPDDNPVSEAHALAPASPYAVSKVAQDLMGYQYATCGLLDVVRVRPFMQLGPRRSDRFAPGSFARQVTEIERGRQEPTIRVGNIDLIRDFTDVRDVARAFMLAAECGATGEVYNIASGRGRSLRDILTLMLRTAGVEATVEREPGRERPGEPSTLIGDASRLAREAGWLPRISFEQSVIDTLDYWRERARPGAPASP